MSRAVVSCARCAQECCCEEFGEKVKENVERVSMMDPKAPGAGGGPGEKGRGGNEEKKPSLRERLHRAFENPQLNSFSQSLYYVTGFFIAISVLANIAETVPVPSPAPGLAATQEAAAAAGGDLVEVLQQSRAFEMPLGERFHNAFAVLDSACVVLFTCEFLMRLFAAPDRLRFLRSVMSIIDLAAMYVM